MTLGERIKTERTKKNVSQYALGELLQITQQAVGRWEKNLSEPDIATLIKLADYFNVSVDYLIGRKKLTPINEVTDEEKALGVGRHPTYLSEDEWNWLELGSELMRIKGEAYYNMVVTMLEAVIKT